MTEHKSAPAYRIKFAADAAAGEVSGFGSIFGNVDSYGEIVEPGAFSKSLAAHQAAGTVPLMLWQHDPHRPIGRWMELEERPQGLFLRGKINLESSWGKDAWAAVEDGDLNGLSIGYREITARPDGIYRRLEELELLEVSVCSFPSNPSARIRVNSKRELEAVLVKAGFARRAADKIASGGLPALLNETADDEDAIAALVGTLKSSTVKIRNA